MARSNHQQLTLAFAAQYVSRALTPSAARLTHGAQTPTNRSTARKTVIGRVARTRTMPARDSRGRFVSFPTTDAPSWYVFCADGYRIPGEPLPEVVAPVAPTTRQPLPRAVARSRRTPRVRVTRAQLLTYLVCVVGYLALLWYGLHLPRPHR